MSESAIAHYNMHATAMRNQRYFYDWLTTVIPQHVPVTTSVCDVGCGTGDLLAALRERGYIDLAGVDFAQGCLDIAHETLPNIPTHLHDIETAPLPSPYDALCVTGVIDFLPHPADAVKHMYESLTPNGTLLLTIRNRDAYWPWYHLRHFAARLIRFPRLHHWFLWFSTPLGMRRTDQPFEHVYSIGEMRRLLHEADFTIVATEGAMWLPMLWIYDLTRWMRIVYAVDKTRRRLPGKSRFYQYMFVCRKS